MTERKCKRCLKPFKARTADVARGWAKFCSKSCKASAQEARTGQMRTYLRRKADGQRDDYDPSDDPSWDAHKDWI